ncbi:MAG TPA: allophanate hydrolase [Planctomycetaceae bacterium]|nr:allophanate hydrolase [Planctomycetaceae bacterium]HBC64018.1 allophanate hydrolase [Planctomycetaceae bacterium]
MIVRIAGEDLDANLQDSTDRVLPTVEMLGDAAVMLRWEGVSEKHLESIVPAVWRLICELQLSGVRDVIPGFESVTVCFNPRQCRAVELAELLLLRVRSCQTAGSALGRELRISVRFSREDSPDLEDVSRLAGLSVRDCIDLLAGCRFRVRMIGFSPGFPYLSGLPECLRIPRLATPRRTVPAGSFAIAAGQAGIYPQCSPGGWRLLGRTEQRLFDVRREPPSLLRVGDLVRIDPCGPLVSEVSGGAGQ